MRAPARTLALLFAVSLALRFAVFLAVERAQVPLLFDEAGYFDRALAWQEILSSLGHLEPPGADAWSRAYGRGHWPPLHPLLLAVGMTVGGAQVWAARLVMVLVSALTTPLVFLLTLDVAGRRPAWAAAGLHLVYPSFVAYSHYLWSETTAIFLLLAAVLAAVRAAAGVDDRRTLAGAAGAGVLLGLAALSRAAALPFLPVVAVWLFRVLRRRRIRLAGAGAVLVAGLAVVAPWQAVVAVQEGRFAPLSTLGGFNLALGNNPWVPPGLGSSWGHEPSKARLFAALGEIAERRGTSWEAAGRVLAWEEIRRHPAKTLARTLERLRMLWAPDFFPLRHLFHAVYPPLPPPVAGVAALAAVAAYLALVTATILGLFSWRGVSPGLALTAILVAAGMVLPALTVGMSRLHLPLLALLLPAAGRGVLFLRSSPAPRRIGAAAVIVWLLFATAATGSVRYVVGYHLLPSSYYAGVLAPLAGPLGVSVSFRDRIILRRQAGVGGELRIRALAAGTSFGDGSSEKVWPAAASQLRLALTSRAAAEIALVAAEADAELRVQPIAGNGCRRWRPTGLPGVDVLWLGGGA